MFDKGNMGPQESSLFKYTIGNSTENSLCGLLKLFTTVKSFLEKWILC